MHVVSLRKQSKEGMGKCPPRRKQARERGGNDVYVRAETREEQFQRFQMSRQALPTYTGLHFTKQQDD